MNPLIQLTKYGQAVWLDDIHRDLMTSGELKRLIDEDRLRGMTSNPAIFNKAIADDSDYEEDIAALRKKDISVEEIFQALAVKDVRMAADLFRPLHEGTHGTHGYVSIEVNPHLARDAGRTIEEAHRLWAMVDRPNIFIKVPGTEECLPAITHLIREGINVNVTLIFGLVRYGKVAEAYLDGIEMRLHDGKPVQRIRSVASFFLSRIDALLDGKLEEVIHQGGREARLASELRGQIAIASAKTAYQMYGEVVSGDRWKQLADKGANPQLLLWASTSTKNPDYSDVKYVDSLIGPESINTVPMKTLKAYRDHGQPQPNRISEGVEDARRLLAQLPRVGLDLDDATQQLENEGIEKFCKPFDALLETLERQVATVSTG